jgi:hypothetical protein
MIWSQPVVAFASVGPGTRVRVTYDVQTGPGLPAVSRSATGKLASLTADTLYLNGPPMAVARSAIGRIEIKARNRNRTKIAVLSGVVVGGVAIVATASASTAGSNEGAGSGPIMLLSGVAGFFVGAIAGALLVRDTWEAIPLDAIGSHN